MGDAFSFPFILSWFIHHPAPSIIVNCERETRQSSWQRDLCSQSNIKAIVVLNWSDFFTFKNEETVVSKTKDKQW